MSNENTDALGQVNYFLLPLTCLYGPSESECLVKTAHVEDSNTLVCMLLESSSWLEGVYDHLVSPYHDAVKVAVPLYSQNWNPERCPEIWIHNIPA